MHLPSAHVHSEFLATPQLVRFEPTEGEHGLEARLLIKASSLLLKYVVQGVRLQLGFFRISDRLLYALKIYDDPAKPTTLWSVLERDEEKAALCALLRDRTCGVVLFNELAVSVASSTFQSSLPAELSEAIEGARTGIVDHSSLKSDVFPILEAWVTTSTPSSIGFFTDVRANEAWNPLQSWFITSRATHGLVDLFNSDEGRQQEHLALWLTDRVHPRGVHHSPTIPWGNASRELTDLLLSYDHGTILIESKTLSIFARSTLPSRAKLARDVSGHITKAIAQLRGAIRQLNNGTPVTSANGEHIGVERTRPIHAIVLIPDLDLIEDRRAFGNEAIREFADATNSFLHLLDISELLRVVQAAELIAARGTTTTPMMAFDYYLIRRFQQAVAAGTLGIEVLLRFGEPQT